MSAPGESSAGVWESLRRLLDTLLSTAQDRLELLAVELQEEKCRLVEALLCAAAVAAFGMMTLTLLTFTLVVLFWESGRLVVLGGLCAVYLGITWLAWRALRLRLRQRTAFLSTLGEIQKDRSCLKAGN